MFSVLKLWSYKYLVLAARLISVQKDLPSLATARLLTRGHSYIGQTLSGLRASVPAAWGVLSSASFSGLAPAWHPERRPLTILSEAARWASERPFAYSPLHSSITVSTIGCACVTVYCGASPRT